MTAPVASLPELLAAPVTKEDLADCDEYCDVGDAAFLANFELAWSAFVKEHPITAGQRLGNIQKLQQQVKELEASKESVEEELKKQLEFFQSSRETLEESFNNKMKHATEKQKAVHETLSAQLDTIAMATHLQQQTLPWQHFLHEMDELAATLSLSSSGQSSLLLSDSASHASTAKAAKPSARAMLLLQDKSGSSRDILLRANRIDHALLTMQIAQLQKEIERYEKMTQSQETAGKFLTEHNVWGILKSSTVSGGSTATSGTTFGSATSSSAPVSRVAE